MKTILKTKEYSLSWLLILVLFSFPILSYSQLSAGLRAGYNYSSMLLKGVGEVNEFAAEYIAADNSIGGFYIGPIIKYSVNDKINLNTELQYNLRGYNPDKLYGRTMRYDMHEINASVLLGYQATGKLNILVGYEHTRRFGRIATIQQLKWNWSLLAGLSLAVFDKVSIEARYNLGIKQTHMAVLDFHGGALGRAMARSQLVQVGVYYRVFGE